MRQLTVCLACYQAHGPLASSGILKYQGGWCVQTITAAANAAAAIIEVLSSSLAAPGSTVPGPGCIQQSMQ